MTTTTKTKGVRLPHGWNAKLQVITGYSQPTITQVIHSGDVDHDVWKAYEKLLSEQVKMKKEGLARVQQLRNELSA